MQKTSIVLPGKMFRLLGACLLKPGFGVTVPSCPELSTRIWHVHLLGARLGLRNECIEVAIAEFERSAYVPASAALALYLDFKVVAPQSGRQHVLNHLPRMDEYPAARALYSIEPATDSLVRAIEGDAFSETVRRMRPRFCS